MMAPTLGSMVQGSRWIIPGLIVAIVFLFSQSALAQCAMCRTALESSAEGRALAEGFRKGILLLMAMPYIIVGTISYGVFRAHRKMKREKTE